jgi:hypothetical protein
VVREVVPAPSPSLVAAAPYDTAEILRRMDEDAAMSVRPFRRPVSSQGLPKPPPVPAGRAETEVHAGLKCRQPLPWGCGRPLTAFATAQAQDAEKAAGGDRAAAAPQRHGGRGKRQ